MYINRNALLTALGLGMIFASSHVFAQTDYLYVTDYGAGTANPAVGGNMDRYQFTYDSSNNTITNFTPYGAGGNLTNAVFISGAIKEGIQGTQNDIICVATGGNSLTRYDLNGNLIGNIPLTLGGNPYTMNGIGNIVISPDGQYLYAAEAGANVIDKVSLRTGAIVTQVAFAGAHDLALNNGVLYAAAYSGNNTSSQGVWTFDTNLGSAHQLIPLSTFGSTEPTGMSIIGNTLYVNGNIVPTSANSVYAFTLSNGGTTAVLNSGYPHSSGLLNFVFGNAIGPDGNLYIAGLGGASGRTDAGYTDGVYEFNTTSNAVSLLVGGESGSTTTGPAGSSGLYSPKYLQFQTNFVPSYDPGVPGAPEPGSVALFCAFGVTGAAYLRRRKRVLKSQTDVKRA